MGSIVLKVRKLHPDARLPERASEGASGFDLFACIKGEAIQLTRDPKLIGTGIAIEIPRGYDAQIRPRSGLSARGVGVALGTVDSDYRGEVMVTMYVLGDTDTFDIKHGDRIAQLVITRLADIEVQEAQELSATARGTGGHGSTGTR